MKRKTKIILLIFGVLFLLILIVPLFVYDWALSYGEFVFQGIEKRSTIDNPAEYLRDAKYDKYRVDNVMVIPKVIDINSDQYALDFIAYAADEDVKVLISEVSLLNDGQAVSIPFHKISIQLQEAGSFFNRYFEGAERYYCIPKAELHAVSGEKYELSLKIEIEKTDGHITERNMTYYADVIQYKSLVLPT